MTDIQLRIGDSAQAVIDGKTITVKILNAFFSFGALEGVVLTIWHDVDGKSHETKVTLRELQQWFSKIKWTKLPAATAAQEAT